MESFEPGHRGEGRIRWRNPHDAGGNFARPRLFRRHHSRHLRRRHCPSRHSAIRGHERLLATSRLHDAVHRQRDRPGHATAEGEYNAQERRDSFSDLAGNKLFQDDDRSLTPVEVNSEKTFHAELFSNLWDSTEAFYGLGQHQAGLWNYHGESVELSQDNTNISVPMFLSSKGYGIFWNNPSRSRFNNRFPHALYLSSEVADTVDYYFLYGPEVDPIIAAYRRLHQALCVLAEGSN